MISVFLLADTGDALIFKAKYICLIVIADCCLVFRLSFNFGCRVAIQEFAGLSIGEPRLTSHNKHKFIYIFFDFLVECF